MLNTRRVRTMPRPGIRRRSSGYAVVTEITAENLELKKKI
jgi:hypothetical protein